MRWLLNKLPGMALTAILAIFGAYFATLFGFAAGSSFVSHNEIPDNAMPFFIGGIIAFYFGMFWKGYTL